MQREIRRCRDNLVSIGTGVAMFGIWTAVRIVMSIILERRELISETQNYTDADLSIITSLLWMFTAILSLTVLGIHLYIGLSARSEGLGGKKRTGYLIADAVYIAVYCVGITAELVKFNDLFDNPVHGIVTIFIDITVAVTLAELMTNAVRSRKLAVQPAETEDRNAD
ncbi:MAG: hypothetical protein J5864_03905 [Oscillospiraceae bacterium]|nr:hypothetical protein [Oscillospiraceae bacterium]